MQIPVKVKRLHAGAFVPIFHTAGAACFDLHTVHGGVVDGDPAVFCTGLAFEIPPGYVMLVFSRSGHGFKHGVRLANCVGVIDSDYRGEVLVKLTTDEYSAMPVSSGDRIAQAMIVQLPQVAVVEVDELSATDRGEGGFGSTGM